MGRFGKEVARKSRTEDEEEEEEEAEARWSRKAHVMSSFHEDASPKADARGERQAQVSGIEYLPAACLPSAHRHQ